MADSIDTPQARLRRLAGGPRGVVEGALPALTFVTTNAALASRASEARALTLALGAALAVAGTAAALALLQRRPLTQALTGQLALAVSTGYAAWAGNARAFFLPGIWVDAAYAVALSASVLARRPLIGIVHGWLFGHAQRRWWDSERVRSGFAVLTLGWAGVYATRATVQAGLYRQDETELLAAAKIGLGWPLTVVGIALSIAWLRRRNIINGQGEWA